MKSMLVCTDNYSVMSSWLSRENTIKGIYANISCLEYHFGALAKRENLVSDRVTLVNNGLKSGR